VSKLLAPFKPKAGKEEGKKAKAPKSPKKDKDDKKTEVCHLVFVFGSPA
jgi:hypothetical protein